MRNSAKRGLLFVHGFLGDNDEFKHLGRFFERSHHIAYVSPQDLHAVVKESRRAWHLVGYSMGGRVALQVACQMPQWVSGLTLISASPGIADAKQRRARLLADRTLSNVMRQTSMREFLNYWYRQPLFRQFRAHPSFAVVKHKRLRQCPVEMSRLLVEHSTGAQESLWSELHKLRISTEVVVGEYDSKFCDIGMRMAACNPQIQRMVVAKVGHVVHWEAPKAVLMGILNVESRMAARAKF